MHNFVKIYFKNFALPVVNIHIQPPTPKYFSRYGLDYRIGIKYGTSYAPISCVLWKSSDEGVLLEFH